MKKFSNLERAQLSLEFLLVMAGFVMALALFTPVAVRASKNAIYSMETLKAREFLSGFRSAAMAISFLSDGSAKELALNPTGEWQFSAGNSKATLSLNSKTLNRSDSFTVSIPAEVKEFNCTLSRGNTLRVEKIAGTIHLSLVSAD